MIMRTKNEQLLFVFIPIGTEATEYRGSIIHRMREHAEFDFGIRNDAALIKHEIWQRHGFTSRSIVGSVFKINRSQVMDNPDQSTTRAGSATGRPSTWKASRLTTPTNVAAK